MAKLYHRLFATLAVLSIARTAPAPPSGFDHHLILFPDIYNLYWKVVEDEIHFEVQVKTLGYVGFGISPNGGMKGADIVTGWVKDDVAYFQDRYATGKSEPEIDEEQNWLLLEANEADGYTTLRFKRPLQTCDTNDIAINDETMRIIYAYHPEDPVGENSTKISYHGNDRRGTKSVTLIISEVQKGLDDIPEHTGSIEFLNPNVTIPAVETTYWCQAFLMPNHDKKHHVVRIEPVVAPGSEAFIHHITIYGCTHISNGTEFHGRGAVCNDDVMGDLNQCTLFIYAWAVGGTAANMPDHVGFPISDGSFTLLKMTTHYDNPTLTTGIRDTSGLRLYYANELREYDAWNLALGAAVGKSLIIPPKFDSYVHQSHCTPQCIKAAIPEGEDIKLFGLMLHGHLLTRRITVRHFRGDKELPYIANDIYYDFNYQDLRLLPNEVTVKRGDSLMVECEYNSTLQTNVTFGGESTREEMCDAFILYYPKLAWSRCSLAPMPLHLVNFIKPKIEEQRDPSVTWFNINYHFKITSPKEFATTNYLDVFYKVDWSDPKWRKRYQDHMLQNGWNLQYCNEVFGKELLRVNIYAQPKIKEYYTPHDACSGARRISWNGIFCFILLLATRSVNMFFNCSG